MLDSQNVGVAKGLRDQQRPVDELVGRVHRSTSTSFLGYLFTYQAVTSAAALRGYVQSLAGVARRW